MKQVIQDLSSGHTRLVEAPAPTNISNHVLINTRMSLVSAGTERMLVEFGKAGLVQKARQQPEKVSQVLGKLQTDGILTTFEAVKSKLNQPIPLGYCNVGTVSDVGSGVSHLNVGDRVASNGPHAELVRVPKNLCVKIPDAVSDESASFTALASIGLQGIRLAEPTLGETVVVIGVGLIGLLTIQLLISNGCRVFAIDYDSKRLDIAAGYGASICNLSDTPDPVDAAIAFSRGVGVDGVIITASTKSNDPVSLAARMCRKRGRIVLVGVSGLDLKRSEFYEKELSFKVSCSYGPGRYDSNYEENGHDYPIGFVRWTEQRNFEAVLDMMAKGNLDVSSIISARFDFDDAPSAYQLLSEDKASLGILLSYSRPVDARLNKTITVSTKKELAQTSGSIPNIAVIGAGNYATRMLIPAFKSCNVNLHTIVSTSGTSAGIFAERAGFDYASSDALGSISHSGVDVVAIATRHDSHASLTIDALNAGKHVFVEKPLALTREELARVMDAQERSQKHLTVGFNRRFSPLVTSLKKQLKKVNEPKVFVILVNAGSIPADHWTQDLSIGGGRILGEACHHIDLMRFLAGAEIDSVQCRRMGKNSAVAITEDKAVITLGFKDGSFGTIHYLANGGTSFPKERIEVFAGGGTLQLDNFVKLRGFNWPGFKNQKLWKQDKGQKACIEAFMQAIKEGAELTIPIEELHEVASVTLDVVDQLRSQN